MAADRAFLLPVVIDDTRDDDERVPERFREVQWTRLPGGVTPAPFVERARRLLSGEQSQERTRTESAAARVAAAPSTRKPVLAFWRSKAALVATIAVVIVALSYLVANRLVLSKRGAEVALATAFNPPPHSIAVLPFVNLSGVEDGADVELVGNGGNVRVFFEGERGRARRDLQLVDLRQRVEQLLGQPVGEAEVLSLDPDYKETYGDRGLAYYGLGDLDSARTSCGTKPDYWLSQQCLAVIYDKLGRHADAEAVLSKMKTEDGDTSAYQYATIYAQWGNRPQALEWLETALRVRDPGLVHLKTDPLMEPLRQEPRFQAIERELKFPS